jgi:hypothetical protein
LTGFLQNPFDGIAHFFGDFLLTETVKRPDSISGLVWDNHKYSMCHVILELHCLLHNSSIFDMMIQAREFVLSHHKNMQVQRESIESVKRRNCDRCGRNFDVSEKERVKLEMMGLKMPNRCRKCM